MRSGVTLHLELGAIIVGSGRLDDYPLPEITFVDAVGDIRGRALVMAENVSDFAITGEGIIDGNGGAFLLDAPEHKQRPFLFRLVNSSRFQVSGIMLRHAAAWTCHLMNCEDALIENIRIDSRVNENNDGIDIDSSRRVTVRHCEIFTDDDAICLKATRPEPCEDIEVHDCVLGTECSALKLGTESYGDIRRVNLHDCRVVYAATGAIKLLTSDGGIFEDVEIRNIDIDRGTGPIFLRLGNRGNTYAPGVPVKGPGAIRRVTIAGIRAKVFMPAKPIAIWFTKEIMPPEAFSGILFTGIPGHCIEDVTMEDCDIEFVGGFAGDPKLLNPPEQPALYPEHFYFGALPGAACFLRHARDLTLRRVKFSLQNPDSRPLLAVEDVENLTQE